MIAEMLTPSLASGPSYMCKTAMTYVRQIISPFEHMLTTSIVPVQNYITAIVVFLIVEQLMTWGFYGKSSGIGFIVTFI